MPGLLGQVLSTVDQAVHPSPRSWHTYLGTGPQSLRARKPESQHPPHTQLHVLDPRRSASHSTPSARQARLAADCLCATARSPPTHLATPPVPARPSPASTLALCISRLSRACVCVCLPIRPWLRAYLGTYSSGRKRNRVCVSVCRVFNLFLSFLHRPYLPCQLAFLPTTALSLSPLLLSTLSCRVAVAAATAAPPPLAVLVVRQDNLDTSFISSPCTIEFTFALRTLAWKTIKIPPSYPPKSTTKKHRHFIPSRIIPAQLQSSGNNPNVRLRAPGLS